MFDLQVVQERYLKLKQHTLYIHFMLAHYYQGTWGGGKKKPFKYSQQQAQMLGKRTPCVLHRVLSRFIVNKYIYKIPAQNTCSIR